MEERRQFMDRPESASAPARVSFGNPSPAPARSGEDASRHSKIDAPAAVQQGFKPESQSGNVDRTDFDAKLQHECASSAGQGIPFSFALVRVDALERLKAQWGPKASQNVLAGVAKGIRGSLRSVDGIFNWDDETFALILADVDAETATIITERLRRSIGSARDLFSGFPVRPTISIGVVTSFSDSSADELKAEALANLKLAVDAGGDRVVPML